MRARLKAATMPLHRAVEQALDPHRRVRTLPEYRALLLIHWGIMPALEERVHAVLGEMPWSPGTALAPRAPRLWADLRALGMASRELESAPRCRDLPSFGSRHAALGGLYVLEGSALGGQVLFRHVARTLGITRTSGGSYFYGDGPETGRQWRRFVAMLESEEASEEEEVAAAEAACQTFGAIARWVGADPKEG